MNIDEQIKKLNIENLIWVINIAISIFNIYGDELIKDSIRKKDMRKDLLAKKVFSIILIVTLIIYIYFFKRNYNDLEKHKTDKKYKVRLLGSVFAIASILCFLYFQLKSRTVSDSLSNV